MDFTIPEDLKMIQSLARKFVKEELLPIEKQVEEADDFPDELRRKLRKKSLALGLWNYAAPVEYGGGGLGQLGRCLIFEEVGRVSQAVGLQGGVIGECRETRLLDATEQQKKDYLMPFLQGEKELCTALTEANAGSDTRALETRAVKQGKNWVINGSKTFITMADRAAFAMLYAVTRPDSQSPGITCFLVDKGTPGYNISRRVHTFGRRGCGVFELSFDNCVVPDDKVLGEVDHGLRIIFSGFAGARLRLGAHCVGVASRANEMAMEYARTRVTFGKPLAERQMVQSMLVDNAININATRMLVYQAAWQADQGENTRVPAMMVKVFGSEMATKAVDDAIQIHGGFGYSKDMVLEMMYRDIRLFRIADGATQMAKSWIASHLLGIEFS